MDIVSCEVHNKPGKNDWDRNPWVTFGCPRWFLFYYLSEFIDSFYVDGSNGAIVYNVPDGGVPLMEMAVVKKHDIGELNSYLRTLPLVRELCTKVDYLESKDNISYTSVISFKEAFKTQSPEIKENFKVLLTMTLFAGMHYRWWLGPGDSYKYLTADIRKYYANAARNDDSRTQRANILNIAIREIRNSLGPAFDPYSCLPHPV